jgi:hypothetical protein
MCKSGQPHGGRWRATTHVGRRSQHVAEVARFGDFETRDLLLDALGGDRHALHRVLRHKTNE